MVGLVVAEKHPSERQGLGGRGMVVVASRKHPRELFRLTDSQRWMVVVGVEILKLEGHHRGCFLVLVIV